MIRVAIRVFLVRHLAKSNYALCACFTRLTGGSIAPKCEVESCRNHSEMWGDAVAGSTRPIPAFVASVPRSLRISGFSACGLDAA